MPLANAKPCVPPSSTATLRSNASRVGFVPRAYSYPCILPERVLHVRRGQVDGRHDRARDGSGRWPAWIGAGAEAGVEIVVGKTFVTCQTDDGRGWEANLPRRRRRIPAPPGRSRGSWRATASRASRRHPDGGARRAGSSASDGDADRPPDAADGRHHAPARNTRALSRDGGRDDHRRRRRRRRGELPGARRDGLPDEAVQPRGSAGARRGRSLEKRRLVLENRELSGAARGASAGAGAAPRGAVPRHHAGVRARRSKSRTGTRAATRSGSASTRSRSRARWSWTPRSSARSRSAGTCTTSARSACGNRC